MFTLPVIAKLIVAVSIFIVWVLRHENIVKEFNEYGLSGLTRSAVGAAKISLATVLTLSIWYPVPVVEPALVMAFLMLCAQYFHFKVGNPWHKRVPSFGLLLLCVYVAGDAAGWIG